MNWHLDNIRRWRFTRQPCGPQVKDRRVFCDNKKYRGARQFGYTPFHFSRFTNSKLILIILANLLLSPIILLGKIT